MNAMPHEHHEAVRELVARAAALRPLLRDQQAATEANGYPTQKVYDAIVEAELFNILTPKRYGGYELNLDDFYRVVIEIARGCPETGWWFALGTGHSAQIASYFSAEAQAEIFGLRKNFQAPWSFAASNTSAEKVDGGYRVSGTWYYCSGVPYASHFMGNIPLPKKADTVGSPMLTIVVPDGSFTRLDNWGDLLGMKGSGSHGVTVKDVFVPERMTFSFNADEGLSSPTIGFGVHGNYLYSGLFAAFAEGGLSAMSTGLAYAAVDEYEELIATRNTPGASTLRALNPDYQRQLGMATALADSARAITLSGGAQYLENAKLCATGVEPFTTEKAMRMDGTYHTAERLAYEAIEILVRTASSTALKADGRLARYMRDILMTISRGHDQFEFRAAGIAKEILGRNRGLSF
ncbi:acyl-CoA dehydrogenase family protein [Rhizobium sp. KVB221]|uniref:Acyl-CoA dehydrogenase family protein n=1 Tax=Rhizobium setariae TaxID=2801340 RepID=A0A936YSU6_9HYPH|nr:acyl-CoA dehydrogenase family protein [Rhizobium setariae]MBL0374237.1 acyl-CoA dehydrogenase family protein [Rhizobium setariae]